uniref:uncharacterized protein n=1 Tax=Semicossyphus pulcher TaxID=241346 RepID=UPI0037E8C7D9
MYPRRSSRGPKPSPTTLQRSPSPNDIIQRRSMGKRQRKTGLQKTNSSKSAINTDEGRGCDILDIINRTHSAKGVIEGVIKDEGKCVEVADKGVDESDEDCVSVSSIASGPSLLSKATPKTAKPSLGLCSACQKLYQKAKRMKAPIKDKLLDNDPKSLTCDQWVLIKSWRPRKLPDTRGKLLTHVTLVKRRLRLKNGAKQIEQRVKDGESAACSRPHMFLQRNLRRLVKVPVKRGVKKNRKKRRRDDSQGSQAAKQQRLHHQHTSTTNINSHHPTSAHSSSPALESCSEQETNTVTVQMIPCSVTLEPVGGVTATANAAKKKKATRGGFRDLLSQLRGNSSMIVRETR